MASGFWSMTTFGVFGLGTSVGLLIGLTGLASRRLPKRLMFATVAALALLSATLVAKHADHPGTDTTVAAAGSTAVSSTPATASANAGSMETATAVLATRLAAKGGSDADWELLAKSYDFLGRSAEAQQARQHKVSPQRSLQESVATSAWLLARTSPGGAPAGSTAATGSKTADLLALAEQHRRKREFQQACATYRSVIAAGGMNADAWADYADALASASPAGSLKGEPAQAIDRALALDPRHPKALWLKASLAHEEHRYQDALATWRRLLAVVPRGSSDARIVEANIAEATRLAGVKG